ncbi:MAG TPA: YIP1 family protein [Granulicella sp.]|nr:YIP1 family protein [Granulicella sp.]
MSQDGPVLSPLQRVADAFVAPTKTFTDVKRGAAWWLPFLIAAVVGLLYGFTILHKVGLPTLVDGVVHQSSALEDRLASATPEQAAAIRSSIETQFKLLYAAPVFSLLGGLMGAGILLATANFVAGGKATYKQMLGVWFYGTLPLTVFNILVTLAVAAGLGVDQFNIKNPVGSNIGYYLMGGESPKWLVELLSAADLFSIWTAVLLTIGVSTVAGIKRGAAAAVVVGWWLVFVLLKVVAASIGG